MRTQLLLSALLLTICAAQVSNAQCPGITNSTTGAVTWTPQWCDEFNGGLNSAIDSTRWTFDTGNSGFGNNELETYCDPASNTVPCSTGHPNAYIDGRGHLAIQARSVGSTWTSARLKTAGKQSFNSGRIEASLQIPSHTGLWPAFWNLGSQPGVSWPMVGESDIMENWPVTSNIAGPGATGNCSTIHTRVTGDSGEGRCFTLPTGQQIDTAFHTYGQIWSANMIQYYIDDHTRPSLVLTASDRPAGDTWPFSSSANPFFLILNTAVGGTLGAPTDSATGSQPPMLADYVRQYVPSPVVPQLSQPAALTVKAGATSGNTASVTVTQTQGTGRTAFSCMTSAPKTSCLVTTSDSVNQYTADFSSSSTTTATVTVTTTGGNGKGSNGTSTGNYTVTVNAYTISSSDAASPSAKTVFNLKVN